MYSDIEELRERNKNIRMRAKQLRAQKDTMSEDELKLAVFRLKWDQDQLLLALKEHMQEH